MKSGLQADAGMPRKLQTEVDPGLGELLKGGTARIRIE